MHAGLEIDSVIWWFVIFYDYEGWEKEVPCYSLLNYATHLHVFVSIIYFVVVTDRPVQMNAWGDKTAWLW